jgi:FkbM family methyltransferase
MGVSWRVRRAADRPPAGAEPGKAARPVRPLPLLARCPDVGERVPGQPCGSPLLRCNRFGDTTVRFGTCQDAQRSCQSCDHHPARAPLPDPVRAVRAAFAAEFAAEVERCRALAYPEGEFRGTGIVIPAGGWQLLPGVFVAASLLRWQAINSRLPIEVWYVGDEGEYDPIFSRITAGLDVTWRDASAELRARGIELPERLHGWAVKPLALLLSSFERVVMMDSDCYPVYDPERLYDDPRIDEQPAAFWPDNPGHAAGRPLTADQWAAFGLAPVDTPGFESGQMVVDKRRSWAAVNAAAWLAGRMDYFDGTRADRGRVKIHGDKEIFSIAWNATRTPYLMAPPVRFSEVAFLQHDPDGAPAFVHRCQDKIKVGFAEWKTPQKHPTLNVWAASLPHEHMVHHFAGKFRDLLRPPLPAFRDGTQDEQVWLEVGVENCYRLPKRMDGLTVVDVGGHAGFFAHECCRRGARLVVCVEPFMPSILMARRNLAPWTARARLVEAAVVGPDLAGRPVAVRGGRSEAMNAEAYVASFHGVDGPFEAATVTLDDLIELAGGRVDLLKIDAEGAEYPALLTAAKLDRVARIAGEFHTVGLNRHPRELRECLERHGFTVEMDENLEIGLFFATRPG